MSTQGKVANFPDADLIPSNIKAGVDIFGVVGTLSGGVPSGSGPTPNFFFGFDGTEALLYESTSRVTCGTFQNASAIYFVVGMCTGGTGAGNRAKAVMSIARLDKGTGAVTYFHSGPVETGTRSTGTLGHILNVDGTLLQFAGNYSNDSDPRRIEFDTATDTFTTLGANILQIRYGRSTTPKTTSTGAFVDYGLAFYKDGVTGAPTGSAMTNSEVWNLETYSTSFLHNSSSGAGNSAEVTMAVIYAMAEKV